MSNTRKPPRAEPAQHTPEQPVRIWGIHSVLEALQSNPEGISEIRIQKGKDGARLQKIIDLARVYKVRLRFTDPARLGVSRQCSHQGVVAQLAALPVRSFAALSALLKQRRAGAAARILALDCIQDPGNMGSMLRSALAAGFTHILITRDRSTSVTPAVVRISAGAAHHVHIYQVVNMAEALASIKEDGYWVYGTVVDQKKAQSIYRVDFAEQVCLVVGSEGKGIRPLVQKQCDQLVTIPMQGRFNSLNAAVAAAIFMFEVYRRSLH